MHLAPVPGCGTRLELHRRNIGAGDNKIALDVAHGEGGHRASLAQKKKPRAWRGKNGIAVRANQPRRNEPTRMGWTGRAPAPNRSDGEDRDGGVRARTAARLDSGAAIPRPDRSPARRELFRQCETWVAPVELYRYGEINFLPLQLGWRRGKGLPPSYGFKRSICLGLHSVSMKGLLDWCSVATSVPMYCIQRFQTFRGLCCGADH